MLTPAATKVCRFVVAGRESTPVGNAAPPFLTNSILLLLLPKILTTSYVFVKFPISVGLEPVVCLTFLMFTGLFAYSSRNLVALNLDLSG